AQRETMAGRLQHEMIMLAEVFGIDSPAPAHPEMEHHGLVAIGVEQAVFGPPAERGHPRAGERLDQIGRKRTPEIRTEQRDALDPFAFEEARETAHGGFDFG